MFFPRICKKSQWFSFYTLKLSFSTFYRSSHHSKVSHSETLQSVFTFFSTDLFALVCDGFYLFMKRKMRLIQYLDQALLGKIKTLLPLLHHLRLVSNRLRRHLVIHLLHHRHLRL